MDEAPNETAEYTPMFSSVGDFVAYLNGTLIPDLRESGSFAMVDDLQEAIYWMKEVKKNAF